MADPGAGGGVPRLSEYFHINFHEKFKFWILNNDVHNFGAPSLSQIPGYGPWE
jgi:hypothetical protein